MEAPGNGLLELFVCSKGTQWSSLARSNPVGNGYGFEPCNKKMIRLRFQGRPDKYLTGKKKESTVNDAKLDAEVCK